MINQEKLIAELGDIYGKTIADLGCGAGAWSIEFADRIGPDGSVMAVDVDQNILERCAKDVEEKKLQNIHIIRANFAVIGGTGLQDSIADISLLINTIFQNDAEEYDDIFAEVNRITKLGGRVIVVDWAESFGQMGPSVDDVFSRDEAIKYGEKAGLRLLREFDVGYYHYGIVFEK